MKNLVYRSANLSNYYREHRKSWGEFYPSEHKIFERLSLSSDTSVLDMGCATGGLGLALNERFGVKHYSGVDINAQCIEDAKKACPWANFQSGDFLELESTIKEDFDVGVSLSCADWNVRTEDLLRALYKHIKPGGHLVFSCRLTNEPGVAHSIEAKQALRFTDNDQDSVPEYAPYKLYTLSAVLELLRGLGALESIYGYGYGGNIPATVEGMSFKRAFYIVFAVKKAESTAMGAESPRLTLDVSTELFRL